MSEHTPTPRRLWADVPKEERIARAQRQAAATSDPVMRRALLVSAVDGIGYGAALEWVYKRMRGEK